MMQDFFEIDRLIEDLAKIYSTACASTWFKLSRKSKPTKEEFRSKAVEFMNHFQYSLSKFPENEETERFRDYANNRLAGRSKESARRKQQGGREKIQVLCWLVLTLKYIIMLCNRKLELLRLDIQHLY